MEKTIKELLIEMSEEELSFLLFEPGKYRPLWRLMQTNTGRILMPDYMNMSWADRAREFSKIAGWTVDEISLRRTFVRFDVSRIRMRQMS